MSILWIACATIVLAMGRKSIGDTNPGTLQIAFCTPEKTACKLASDGNKTSCYAARKIEENFYFAMFNTVGRFSTVRDLNLLVGGDGRTKYLVSLASRSKAYDLSCQVQEGGDDGKSAPTGRLLHCAAAKSSAQNSDGSLPDITSLMIRPDTLPITMRLLEVVAYNAERQPIPFAYCSGDEPGVCDRAMDGLFEPDSPLVTSKLSMFPSWYGGFDKANSNTKPVAFVRIYRPNNNRSTFFRVATSGIECVEVDNSTAPGSGSDKVEAIDYACPGVAVATQLLEVWEIDADYFINLCEIRVFGHEQPEKS